jgi:hypothetical protein
MTISTDSPIAPPAPPTPGPTPIKRREREVILQALGSGTVPYLGLQHLQVGRNDEVSAVVRDIGRVEAGAAAFRLVVAPFGAGKTFFLSVGKAVAHQHRFVVLTADLTPERRLAGTSGQARSLYQELMRNASTKGKPDGGALASVVERWTADAKLTPETSLVEIRSRLRSLEDLVGGFDFASVVATYAVATMQGKSDQQSAALRWLRGEYRTISEAKADLGVRAIIDDAEVWDYLKLFASFARLAGFAGLFIQCDEAINLYKLPNLQARSRNYETILRIYNDCTQGKASGVLMVLGGTPEFLNDQRRGLASYEALRSRLAPPRLGSSGARDLTAPVIELSPLTVEELVVLLRNVRRVHAGERPEETFVPDSGLTAFIAQCNAVMGAACFRTPRDTVRQWVTILNVREQQPDLPWESLLSAKVATAAADTKSVVASETAAPGDDLADFKL